MCTPRRVFQPLFTILFLLTWNDATLLASSSASSAPTAPSLQKIYEKNEPVLELYKEPNFQGDPLVLGCCSDMKVSASYSSLRMSAGASSMLVVYYVSQWQS